MDTMPKLSSAAQTVLEAAEKQTDLDFRYASMIAAAVLRAAADQVVPEVNREVNSLDEPVESELQCVRTRLLAIATELENCN